MSHLPQPMPDATHGVLLLVARHASHVTRHTSHVTRHTSRITRHTSHVTRHTSHVTRRKHFHNTHPLPPSTSAPPSPPWQFSRSDFAELARQVCGMCTAFVACVQRLWHVYSVCGMWHRLLPNSCTRSVFYHRTTSFTPNANHLSQQCNSRTAPCPGIRLQHHRSPHTHHRHQRLPPHHPRAGV